MASFEAGPADPSRADATSYPSGRIEDAVFARERDAAARAALIDGEQRTTYAALAGMVRGLAWRLEDAGAQPGDRVAIFLDKSTASVVALYAVWAAGGVAVPINETLQSRQVAHILRHSGSVALVSEPRRLARLDPAILTTVRVVDVTQPLGISDWTRPVLPGGGPAAILYTSGSTGLPKGILISHANLRAGARIVASYLEITRDERVLSVLPFSFDYGLNQLLTTVQTGALLVLQRSHLPADICRALLQHEITGLAAVPPLWIQLLGPGSPLPAIPLPRLRYITNSGGAFPIELVRRYRSLLPHVRIFLMYGLSEAFRSTYLPPEEIDRRPDSMGRAIPETEIHVLGEDGREAAPGETGQLVHRGPTVALGYWQDPQTTAAVFKRCPFPGAAPDERVVYSGDLVRRDADGFLYFVGRRDQLIKTLGYRVSPEEVEETLYASGIVAEAVASGVPDPVAGQVIVVHVVPRDPQAFSVDALLEFCRREMPRYMVPKTIHVRTAIGRTASGKLDRKGIAS
jgi:acyl-CoA ligase (AMP-forming) (exosortase A-associated)